MTTFLKKTFTVFRLDGEQNFCAAPKFGLFQSLVSVCVCNFFLLPSTSRTANTTRNIFLVALPGQTEAGSIRNLPINHVFMRFPSLFFVSLKCLYKHPKCLHVDPNQTFQLVKEQPEEKKWWADHSDALGSKSSTVLWRLKDTMAPPQPVYGCPSSVQKVTWIQLMKTSTQSRTFNYSPWSVLNIPFNY